MFTTSIAFKSDKGTKFSAQRVIEEKGLFASAVDWKLQFDLHHPESQSDKGSHVPCRSVGDSRGEARWCALVTLSKDSNLDRIDITLGREHGDMALPQKINYTQLAIKVKLQPTGGH